MWRVALIAGIGGGCGASAADQFEQSFPTDSVAVVEANLTRGSLQIDGRKAAELTVVAQRAASAGTVRRAVKRNEADPVLIERVLDAVRIDAPASHPERRTDVRITGGDALSVQAVVEHGDVQIEGLSGDQTIEAPRIEVRAGDGDRRLTATEDGLVLSGEPAPGDVWVIDVTGDAFITLPPGVEVRLDALLSEGARAELTGFTFDEVQASDDFVRARKGSGAVDIVIDVRRGTLFLSEALKTDRVPAP
ncbi:MAG: hypothetical protein AAGA48_12845 [Myxococcota bacterium]